MPLFAMTPAKVAKRWAGGNPLECLTPQEVAAAELYARLYTDPTVPRGHRGSISWSGAFRETFGFELTTSISTKLKKHPAWQAYVLQLREQVRATVLGKLEMGAMEALKDYNWSRTEAKTNKDYKEVRLGASDYLDRIGATLKPQIREQHNTVIVIRGKNFDETTLHKPLPMLEAEIVKDDG